MLPLQEGWVQSLFRELRSCKLYDVGEKKLGFWEEGHLWFHLHLHISPTWAIIITAWLWLQIGGCDRVFIYLFFKCTPGEGNGNSLQYSCLENPKDWGAWWAAVHGVAKRHGWVTSLSCIGEGNGNPLQCSCLENPREGGAWWAAIYGVAQGRTWLKRLSSSSSKCILKWFSFIHINFIFKHIFLFSFFSITSYNKILNIASCYTVGPCC